MNFSLTTNPYPILEAVYLHLALDLRCLKLQSSDKQLRYERKQPTPSSTGDWVPRLSNSNPNNIIIPCVRKLHSFDIIQIDNSIKDHLVVTIEKKNKNYGKITRFCVMSISTDTLPCTWYPVAICGWILLTNLNIFIDFSCDSPICRKIGICWDSSMV